MFDFFLFFSLFLWTAVSLISSHLTFYGYTNVSHLSKYKFKDITNAFESFVFIKTSMSTNITNIHFKHLETVYGALEIKLN